MTDIAHTARSIVFIDSRVQDAATLLQGLEPGTEVVFLQAGQDGLAQMAAALGERGDVGAVQVIAHGSAGQLWLGSSFLDNAALQRPEVQALLAALGRGLTAEGDLLVYACNTAQGSDGAQFVSTLAALTGADVAASDDRTGAQGDWELEISTGSIEHAAVLSAQGGAAYQHGLATLTVTSNANSGVGTLRAAISSAVSGDTITFNAGMTVTLAGTELQISKNLIIDGDLDNNGTPDVTIDANYGSRVVSITAGSSVLLDGLTLTHGLVAGNGGTSYTVTAGGSGHGGAIMNAGTLTIQNTTITANFATGGGGGGGAANPSVGGGGGGGSGADGIGGGSGGNAGSGGGTYNGVAGGSGSGGSGGSYSATLMGGRGGTSSGGGAGGIGTFGYSHGGAGATATANGVTLGGGGGGSGWDTTGGAGGSATGALYNTGTVNIIGTSAITNNIGAGGGGGGGGGVGNSQGLGGKGVGGIWNQGGAINITSGNYSAMAGNTGASGAQGAVVNGGSMVGLSPAGVAKIYNNGGTLNTNYTPPDTTPPSVTSINRVGPATTNATSVDYTVTFSESVTGVDTGDFTLTKTGTATGTVSAISGSGSTWTVTVNGITGDGTLRLDLNNAGTGIADATGNAIASGFTSGQFYTVDTTAPSAPSAPDLASVSDSGTSNADNITNAITPTFTGTAEAGATVTLYDSDGTTVLGTGIATGGSWSITSATLGAGTHTLTAKATDAAGNVGAASTGLSVTIDTTAPTLAITSNVSTLKIGETATITFTFSEDPGASFSWDGSTGDVAVSGGTLSALSGTGLTRTATFTPTANTNGGTASITVASGAYTDTAGNNGGAGATPALTFDTLAPAAPSAPDLAAASDTGVSSTDNITNDTTPTFTGTAEAGATVTLYDSDGTTVLGMGTATGSNWSITSAALSAGAHTLSTKATDTAGNVSSASAGLAIVIAAPAIDSAAYDASTGTLVVTGSGMTAGDTIDVSKLSLTGQGGATYLLTSANATASSATAFSVTLNAADKIAVNGLLNNNGAYAVGGATFNLAGVIDWNATTGSAADATGNTVTVSNVIAPTITSATYDGVSHVFTVTGTNLVKTIGATNDITISALTITGEGGATRTLSTTGNVEVTSATSFTFTLAGADIAAVDALLNKNGASSASSATIYNLAVADDWNSVITGGNIADLTGNGITVSNAAPSILSSTYDAATGILSVSAVNIVGSDTIDVSKLGITGQGGSYTLTTAAVTASSSTAFSVTLNAADQREINGILNKNGTSAVDTTTFNLSAAANWNQTTTSGADLTGNGITVSNVNAPTITSASYDGTTHVFTVTGTNLVKTIGATNDITISALTITGEGGATRTLSTTGNVEVTSATSFTFTLAGADIAAVDSLLNKNGTSSASSSTPYNLAVADDWNSTITGGNIEDLTGNGITVSNAAPSLLGATYDAATGILSVSAVNIVGGDTIDVAKLTITGQGGSKTLTTANVNASSSTAFSVTLNAADKREINGILNNDGTSAVDTTTFNLSAAASWNQSRASSADLSGNGITVANVTAPTINSATYDGISHVFTVTGTNLVKTIGATNDITISALTITGEGGATRTLSTTGNVEITSDTGFTFTLTGADIAAVDSLLNKNGTSSASSSTPYNLAVADDWNSVITGGNIQDLTGNSITVANAAPSILGATYDAATGVLSVSAVNIVGGDTIDVSKLSITGQGGSYPLTTASVTASSATAFSVTLNAADRLAINGILNSNGTSAVDTTTFNLSAAAAWNQSRASSADLLGNGVTVSNAAAPTITSATYDVATHILTVTGTNLVKTIGATNDITVSALTVSGEGNATRALTTTGNVEVLSDTSFAITLAGADQAAVEALFNKNGATSTSGVVYNLAASDDWDSVITGGNIADATSPITVSNVLEPAISSATYNASTGVLVVTGTGFSGLFGATNDIVANKFSLQGEGGVSYTLTTTSNVEISSATSFTLTLSAADRLGANLILNKNGTSSTSVNTYNLIAAEDWAAGADAAVVIADLTGNGITVSNVVAPTVTSATYNVVTGVLTVTGINFLSLAGANNDITANRVRLLGEGGFNYTLTDTSNVDITSNTSFTVTMSVTDRAALALRMNKDGTSAADTNTYNLGMLEDWNAGASTAVVIADLFGNGVTVIGNDLIAPVLASASVSGNTLVLAYADASELDAVNVAGTGAFAVVSGGIANAVTNVTVDGPAKTVTLTLATPVGFAQAVTVAYTDPSGGNDSNAIQDTSGNDAATLGVTAVTNNTPDTSAPVFSTATVNGTQLILTYTEATTLDAVHVPAAGDFEVQVGGTPRATTGVVVVNAAAKTVTLTLATAVSAGQAVTVAYTDPTVGDDTNAIQDTAGNDAATFGAATATNLTPTPPPPPPPPAPPAPPPPAPAPVVDGVPVATTPGDGGTTVITIPVVVPTRQDDPNTPNSDLADIPLVKGADGRPIVQVSVPVGVGLQAQGLPNPVSGNAALAELGLRIERIAGSDAELTNSGQVFFASMDPNEPLVVQTITATPGAGFNPDTPFVISGSTNPADGKQAVILDARALPSGTLIQVDNIDFIAVVGAVRVIGGQGQNIAAGDGAAQWIVLGADDDVIRGGGGNDIVASKGGNDRLHGDDGHDAIAGGTGDDHLEGGAGNDILQGGMSDGGAWSFALNADGTLQMRYTASYALLTDTPSTSFAGYWSGQVQDARIAFAYQDAQLLKTISLLHKGLTGELPTLDAMNAFAAQGWSRADALQYAWSWYEATLPADASTRDKVAALYSQTWGEATEDNIQNGLDFLAQGGSWAQGLDYLVSHANVQDLITSEGRLSLTQIAQLGELGWGADSGNDTLLGGTGNDVLIGGNGNDILDGGEGTDMAVFFGAVQQMSLKLRASTASDAVAGQQEVVLRHNLSGEEDILRSVELLQIGGQAYRLELQPEQGQSPGQDDGYQALAGYVQVMDAQELVLVGLPAF